MRFRAGICERLIVGIFGVFVLVTTAHAFGETSPETIERRLDEACEVFTADGFMSDTREFQIRLWDLSHSNALPLFAALIRDREAPAKVRAQTLFVLCDFARGEDPVRRDRVGILGGDYGRRGLKPDAAFIANADRTLIELAQDRSLEQGLRLIAIGGLSKAFVHDETSEASRGLFAIKDAGVGRLLADAAERALLSCLEDPHRLDFYAAHENEFIRSAAAEEVARLRALDSEMFYGDIRILEIDRGDHVDAIDEEIKRWRGTARNLSIDAHTAHRDRVRERVSRQVTELRRVRAISLRAYLDEKYAAYLAARDQIDKAEALAASYNNAAEAAKALPTITIIEEEYDVISRNGMEVARTKTGESEWDLDLGYWSGWLLRGAGGYATVEGNLARRVAQNSLFLLNRMSEETMAGCRERVMAKLMDEELEAENAREEKMDRMLEGAPEESKRRIKEMMRRRDGR